MTVNTRGPGRPATAPGSATLEARLEFAGATHPARPALERFVEARFDAAYGARIRRHYPLLAGVLGADGAPAAVAGVRFAEDGPLFLERYLDGPVEQAVAAAFDQPVCRERIVEIGSLAADAPTASLELFTGLAHWLATGRHRRFAVATARPELQRLLDRAGFGVRSLAAAEPERLGDEAADWGAYYSRAPQVLAGEIGVSQVLPQLRRDLRNRLLARRIRNLRSAVR